MKHFRILLLLVACATGACYEDKGNYDYVPVPEVQLGSAIMDTTILRGQRLTLAPDLKILLQNPDKTTAEAVINPDDYTYNWTAYRAYLADMKPEELATTRVLDTNIYLPVSQDPYRVIYSVTEKATDVTRQFRFKLTITGSHFTNAWLYLTEEDDGTVDLMARGTETTTAETALEGEILSHSGFPYRGGGAKFVYWHSNFSRIIIGTGEATGYIDKNTFSWDDTKMLRFTMVMPQPENYTFDKIISLGVLHCIDSYGNILPMSSTVGIMYPPYNILPPAVTGGNTYDTIRMAPFVGGSSSSITGQLLYDVKNRKMMAYKGSSAAIKTYLETLPLADQLPNHQIYHMQAYSGSHSSIIAKNLGNGKYYRYVYTTNALQPNPEEITNGQLLDQASYFECDNPNGFVYMIIGNKLYAFRSNMDGTGSLQEVRVTNRSGLLFDEITYLGRYTLISSTSSYVMLATYAGSKGSGKIYYLLPDPTEPLDVTIEEEITGLDRVKSISRF
jgi:hypothetical protein